MARALGIDLGSVRVGLALSDPMGWTARPLRTVKRNETLDAVADLVEEHAQEDRIETIVLGLPLHMNGDEGDAAARVRAFAALLRERVGIEPVLWDERLTTVSAERVLIEGGVRRQHRKDRVDQIAAAILLQDYLDHGA